MSDEREHPDEVWIRMVEFDGGCIIAPAMPMDENAKPYLRCPDNIEPSDALVVSAEQTANVIGARESALTAAKQKHAELVELIAEMRDDLCVLSHKPEILDIINRADAILDNKENNNNG